MSWPAPAQPPRQPPPQGYNNQPNMYPNYQGAPPPASTPQQYWPAQQPQYTQQYGQAYQQQQDYGNNANQFYQQPQPPYNQNYANQSYGNTQQQYPQNYYQTQGTTQQSYQTQPNADSWEDNWDWGWDEAGKQAQQAAQSQAAVPPTQPPHQLVYNNANVLEESFVSTDTWNWAVDDKKQNKEATPSDNQEPVTAPSAKKPENNTVSEAPSQRSASNQSNTTEEVKTLSDREVVKEHLPNLALGKRFQLENLTPQWSIESQMSQESSDGPHTHSEGTYRSENQSRNSSKDSPGINTETSNFNYSQTGLDEYTPSSEWSRLSNEEATLVSQAESGSRRESHDEITDSLQELSIANKENPAPEQSVSRELKSAPPPSVTPDTLPPPASSFMAPPTAAPAPAMPPAPPVSTSFPPSSSPAVLPPPTSFPQSSSSNPFKQSGGFSHKKVHTTSPVVQPFPPSSSSNLTSPNVVSKVSQHRVPVGFGANLETTPDNSERPDQPQMSAFRPMPVAQPVPDNLEVAPQNDRNEYMQTAHLSSGEYSENTDFRGGAPPPGLRRMVLGQRAPEEPPPGLARMVPGQHEPPPDDYLERHVDGQNTDAGVRPYRQADGQQTPDNYNQPPSNRSTERRPIGFDRLVPGEPSNDEYPQYQSGNYSANDRRVVMGVDRDYPDAGPSDVREQNVDGSDYSEHTPRPAPPSPPPDAARELTMEGENLQDLSVISSADVSLSREHNLDGAAPDPGDSVVDRKTDHSDSVEPAGSRRHSLNRINTSGEDSERDRAFKSSPRRDRDKHKSSRDRDRDRERDKEGRYSSRGDRKYERDGERRSMRDKDRGDRERDRQWGRDESPRRRRAGRSRRYDTEDTDYCSDRERDRRSYREGSHAKPPRPEDKERRYERERLRRYNTIERDRRPDDRERRRDRADPERYEARYRDIDPSRKHGNLRAHHDDDRRRGYGGGGTSRPESREAPDEDLHDGDRRRDRRSRHRNDPYYDSYGSGAYTDPYSLTRAQYQYYEQLRLTDPHAYLQVYKQLMSGRAPPVPPVADPRHKHLYQTGYAGSGFESREERGSVHSGRSSTGLTRNDTYWRRTPSPPSPRAAPPPRAARTHSTRTDISDRDLNTDASLNLQLEESTVRSERMTPLKFSTAHIKGSVRSRGVVVVRASYPVDGLPATVHIVSLSAATANDPRARELAAYPGPLVKGVTHKKSVIEYCMSRVKEAARGGGRDVIGCVLLWELLALLLRQNGVVVGADIAELLMKNTREYPHVPTHSNNNHNGSRRGSSLSGVEERAWTPDQPAVPNPDLTSHSETGGGTGGETAGAVDEAAALDRLRDHLTYGNRQEALEWAMSAGLWGHAMQLASGMERRARANVASRFLRSLPAHDPLHTLYAHLAARPPPAATCVSDERWGDWRPHVAIMLSNTSIKPEHDQRTLTQLGDSLQSRGLLYSAQFCYVSCGLPFSPHPLAPLTSPSPVSPPRLSLLLADPRATTLQQFATDQAIFATEIYEYALSLNQDFVINELQVYKLILATRLVDCGQYERALGYVESAARAVTSSPAAYPAGLPRALGELGERLRYHDPALQDAPPPLDLPDETNEGPASPHWLDALHHVTNTQSQISNQSTPVHEYYQPPAPPQQPPPPADPAPTPAPQHNEHTYWTEQAQSAQYQPYPPPEEGVEPPPQYYQPPAPPHDDWGQHEQTGYGSYWQGDSIYGENAMEGGEEEAPRPQISLPGSARDNRQTDHTDSQQTQTQHQEDHQQHSNKQPQSKKQEKSKEDSKGGGSGGAGAGGGGWLGGIFNKLALRAPNQMILPDDKNPTIVWDAENKRWKNLEADDEDSTAPPPPPPTTRDLAPQLQNMPLPPGSTSGPAPPPAAPVSNIFKMQKSRHIKKSYVDVLNPGGGGGGGGAGAAPPPPALAPAPPQHTHNYFVPAPINNNQGGMYNPTQVDDDGSRYLGGGGM